MTFLIHFDLTGDTRAPAAHQLPSLKRLVSVVEYRNGVR